MQLFIVCDSFQTEYNSWQFLCHYNGNSNSFLITSLPEYLLKVPSAITVLFNLHRGTTNTQHKRESTTQGCFSYCRIAAIKWPYFKQCLKLRCYSVCWTLKSYSLIKMSIQIINCLQTKEFKTNLFSTAQNPLLTLQPAKYLASFQTAALSDTLISTCLKAQTHDLLAPVFKDYCTFFSCFLFLFVLETSKMLGLFHNPIPM